MPGRFIGRLFSLPARASDFLFGCHHLQALVCAAPSQGSNHRTATASEHVRPQLSNGLSGSSVLQSLPPHRPGADRRRVQGVVKVSARPAASRIDCGGAPTLVPIPLRPAECEHAVQINDIRLPASRPSGHRWRILRADMQA